MRQMFWVSLLETFRCGLLRGGWLSVRSGLDHVVDRGTRRRVLELPEYPRVTFRVALAEGRVNAAADAEADSLRAEAVAAASLAVCLPHAARGTNAHKVPPLTSRGE